MPATTAYEIPITWILDPDYVNEPPDYEYLAWRIGYNETTGMALWVIEAVVPTPTVTIADLLPPDYNTVILDGNEINQTGHIQAIEPRRSFGAISIKLRDFRDGTLEENTPLT